MTVSARPETIESTDGTQPCFRVMPAKAGIHDFSSCSKQSRGRRVRAWHDVLARAGVIRSSYSLTGP